MKEKQKKQVKFIHCLIAVLALVVSMVYGLGIRSFVFHQDSFPVEMCLLLAITITAALLFYLGFSWDELLGGMIRKFSQGVGNYLIMLAIGVVIASWIISGTIPMLIYFGIKIINAQFIYVIAFIIACVFSVCTGTSWGSAGTIGVVLMGVGATIGASLPILAGAIIAGAIFGDKMSPLSDTTNLSAMAAEIDVYEHIRSMAYSTIPAALVSIVLYAVMGFVAPPASLEFDASMVQSSLDGIQSAFQFNPLLLLPPVLVVIGSIRKWPTVPTLIGSSFVALILSLIFQQFSLGDAAGAMINGFKLDMLHWVPDAASSSILSIFERGGLYSMSSTVIIGWMIFLYMGLAELIEAMPTFVNRVFVFAKSRVTIIFSTFAAALATLLVTGNGYAGTLISADVFKSKFDEYNIPRRILSRTLEDGTTMFDPMFSWGPTGMFMASTLGIATIQYLPFMFLTWANTVIAAILAIAGIGGYKAVSKAKEKRKP